MSDTLRSILEWHKAARPVPTERDKGVALGCHFEEVGEGFEAIGEATSAKYMSFIASKYKKGSALPLPLDTSERIALLDALCDQIVTAIGVAQAYGFDIIRGLDEVNRSNYSKFVNGQAVFTPTYKIDKGPNYTPPNLEAFV